MKGNHEHSHDYSQRHEHTHFQEHDHADGGEDHLHEHAGEHGSHDLTTTAMNANSTITATGMREGKDQDIGSIWK